MIVTVAIAVNVLIPGRSIFFAPIKHQLAASGGKEFNLPVR